MTVDNKSVRPHKPRFIKYAAEKVSDGETANGDLIHMDHQGAITHWEKMYPRR